MSLSPPPVTLSALRENVHSAQLLLRGGDGCHVAFRPSVIVADLGLSSIPVVMQPKQPISRPVLGALEKAPGSVAWSCWLPSQVVPMSTAPVRTMPFSKAWLELTPPSTRPCLTPTGRRVARTMTTAALWRGRPMVLLGTACLAVSSRVPLTVWQQVLYCYHLDLGHLQSYSMIKK